MPERGLVVALETSTRTPSVAIEADGTRREHVLSPTASHASDLLPALEALVHETGRAPHEIRAVLVGLGPGSYTGLRVGIATALGLARGAGASLFGVPSGEVLAFGELAEGERCVRLLDARQGELYFARYARERDEVRVLVPARVLRPEELEGLLDADDERIFGDETVGEAAGLGSAQRQRIETTVVPRAGALLELGAARFERFGGQDPEMIEPLYLRAFAARVRKR